MRKQFLSYGQKMVNTTKKHIVDMRSDTVTRPSQQMRDAMANSVVGDDVMKEDPTVNELEEVCAKLFGKEKALFVPSGTMGNLISIMSHCNGRGDEIILGKLQHIFKYEGGAYAQLAGVSAAMVPNNPDGTINLGDIEAAIRNRADTLHQPQTRLICVENTHNVCGGRILPLSYLDELRDLSNKQGLLIHMDGARVYNAAVSLGVPLSRIAQTVDSVSMCFSKGLGAPVGSIVVGSKEFMDRAIRIRKLLGGGMRQAGVIAAAALVALRNAETTLTEDHAKAHRLATGINDISIPEVIHVDMKTVETNIINAKLNPLIDVDHFMAQLRSDEESSVLSYSIAPHTIRFVTHCDVSMEDIEKAVGTVHRVTETTRLP